MRHEARGKKIRAGGRSAPWVAVHTRSHHDHSLSLSVMGQILAGYIGGRAIVIDHGPLVVIIFHIVYNRSRLQKSKDLPGRGGF